MTIIKTFLFVFSSNLASYRIFNKLSKAVLYSKMKFFDSNGAGRIILRLTSDVDDIDWVLPFFIYSFL